MLVRRICHFELRHYDDIVPNDEPVSSNVSFVKFSTWARTLNHDEEINIDYNQSLLIQEETFMVQCEYISCDFKGVIPHICSWLL